MRMSECQENTTDVLGKSSPVSVLEPLFTDDDTSPNSSRFSSGMPRKNFGTPIQYFSKTFHQSSVSDLFHWLI